MKKRYELTEEEFRLQVSRANSYIGEVMKSLSAYKDHKSIEACIDKLDKATDVLKNINYDKWNLAGEISPRCVKLRIASALSEMMDSFQHTGAKKNVSLHLLRSEKDDDLIAAIDSEKFQIIISNLLSNAIEYSADGGKVEVSYSVGGDGCLQVSVLDHGVGIATEDQQRIFDRFVQLNTGTTRSHLGHGLGLSIAKALVDLMQGASAWSARPGECGYRWSGRAEAVFLHQRGWRLSAPDETKE